jgi:phosphoglycerate kinase
MSSNGWLLPIALSGSICFTIGTIFNEFMHLQADKIRRTHSTTANSSNNDATISKLPQLEHEHSGSASTIQLPLPLRDTRNNPPLSISSLTGKQNLDHNDVENKRILVRVDYNVKIKNGVVLDRTRIESTIPTLQALLNKKGPNGKGCKAIILITHLGRPIGPEKSASLKPVADCLQTDYFPKQKVEFLPDCVGEEIENRIAACTPGTIFLCENLRFHPEETGISLEKRPDSNSASGFQIIKTKVSFEQKVRFREQLSRLGDIFVFEAFGAAHRPHSSIIGIQLPQRVAGLLMAKELNYYGNIFDKPQRPFLAIIGGAKVSDKIAVLENLLQFVDEMIIGGGMAYTFLHMTQGMRIGKSIYDEPGAKLVARILAKATERNVKIHLPVDHIIGSEFSNNAKIGLCDNVEGIRSVWMGLDIGPRTRLQNSTVIERASTILWNGPLGVYEMGPFGGGTLAAMQDMVLATKRGATTIIGGGDTG